MPRRGRSGEIDLGTFERWGIRTLGELAAIAPADLVARFGRPAAGWHAVARGEECRPLMPAVEEERFDASMDLEWPIEGLEPLSFVLTRLLEPLSTRLERRDRGAAVLHVILGLALPRSARVHESDEARGDVHARRLELPAPMRDVRTLRTLALLDLESHPPDAPIQSVSIVIEPTPGRIVQHTLFTRAHPTPERVSTLAGAPRRADGARSNRRARARRFLPPRRVHDETVYGGRTCRTPPSAENPATPARASNPSTPVNLLSALRRCRQPVPARVVVDDGRPTRVTTDRRGFAGGAVIDAAGPWRTSGEWWEGRADTAGKAGPAGAAGREIALPALVRPAAPARLRGIATNGTWRSATAACIASSVIARATRGSSTPSSTEWTISLSYPAAVSYIELHAASAFSFLQGASLPEALVDRAADCGYPCARAARSRRRLRRAAVP